MDVKIQALLVGNILIEKFTKKSHGIPTHKIDRSDNFGSESELLIIESR